jgi:hypothetical protein
MQFKLAFAAFSVFGLAGCVTPSDEPPPSNVIAAPLPGYPKNLGFVRTPNGSVCKMVEVAPQHYNDDCVPDPTIFKDLGGSAQAPSEAVPSAPSLPSNADLQISQPSNTDLSVHTLELLNELQVQQDDGSFPDTHHHHHHSRQLKIASKPADSQTASSNAVIEVAPIVPALPVQAATQQPAAVSPPAPQSSALRQLDQNGPSY